MKLPIVSNCDACGVCCRHMGYPSFVYDVSGQADELYWTALPDTLKRPLLAYIDAYQVPPAGQLDGPCWWLDLETGRCQHHHYRPQVCRDFAVGGPECLAWRQAYLVSCRP